MFAHLEAYNFNALSQIYFIPWYLELQLFEYSFLPSIICMYYVYVDFYVRVKKDIYFVTLNVIKRNLLNTYDKLQRNGI